MVWFSFFWELSRGFQRRISDAAGRVGQGKVKKDHSHCDFLVSS